MDVIDHPIEVPGWTRRRAAAAVSRRAAAAPVQLKQPAPHGLVLCWDLLRWNSAWATARLHGWHLATDDHDGRLHPSMCAWHRHLAGDIFPRFEGVGRTLSAVTSAAVAGARTPLVLPNAGYHAGPCRGRLDRVPAGPLRRTWARSTRNSTSRRSRASPLTCPVGRHRRRPRHGRRRWRRAVGGGIRMEPWWDMAEIDRRVTVVICPYVRTPYTASMDPLKIY